MNEKELRAFLTVAERGSFTEAGNQLGLTQPAISKRIASLEARLNTTLFDRVGKRVFVTAAGRALQAEAGKVLAAIADAQRTLANLTEQPDGTLSLATSHHIGLHRLAPVLRRLNDAYPTIRLDIRFEDSEDAAELVAKGQVELAIVTLDPNGQSPLHSQPIWHDPLVFMVAPDHPLATRKRIALATLTEHAAILPGQKTYTGRIVQKLFADAGYSLTPTLATNYLETIHMLVGTGLGWSMLPKTMTGDLHPLTFTTAVERQLGLITNPERTASNAAKRFNEILLSFGDADLVR
ncbi:MAG: LysR family transcriptional regulator [Pseudomonadales bacterium]